MELATAASIEVLLSKFDAALAHVLRGIAALRCSKLGRKSFNTEGRSKLEGSLHAWSTKLELIIRMVSAARYLLPCAAVSHLLPHRINDKRQNTRYCLRYRGN